MNTNHMNHTDAPAGGLAGVMVYDGDTGNVRWRLPGRRGAIVGCHLDDIIAWQVNDGEIKLGINGMGWIPVRLTRNTPEETCTPKGILDAIAHWQRGRNAKPSA